jgi:hypothetical protein
MQPTAEHLMKGLERRAREGFQGYPLAIIVFYGYSDQCAVKAVIGIVNVAGAPPAHMEKWSCEQGDLRKDVASIKAFFRYIESHKVRSVALTPGIYACPHEPGSDYPQGDSCPHCPFWANVKKPDLFNTAKADPVRDRPRTILEMLTEAARKKQTLPYGDLMQTVGLSYSDALHRQVFKEELRAAVRQSELYPHKLLLSALLVFKIQHIPEDDFFTMAQELGLFTSGKDSKTLFFKEHLAHIYHYYAQN